MQPPTFCACGANEEETCLFCKIIYSVLDEHGTEGLHFLRNCFAQAMKLQREEDARKIDELSAHFGIQGKEHPNPVAHDYFDGVAHIFAEVAKALRQENANAS